MLISSVWLIKMASCIWRISNLVYSAWYSLSSFFLPLADDPLRLSSKHYWSWHFYLLGAWRCLFCPFPSIFCLLRVPTPTDWGPLLSRIYSQFGFFFLGLLFGWAEISCWLSIRLTSLLGSWRNEIALSWPYPRDFPSKSIWSEIGTQTSTYPNLWIYESWSLSLFRQALNQFSFPQGSSKFLTLQDLTCYGRCSK